MKTYSTLGTTLLLALALAACGDDLGSREAPNIVVTPSDIAFDSVAIGASSTRLISIANDGETDLVVRDIVEELSTNDITVDFDGTARIAPQEQIDLSVTFAPSSPVDTSGRLLILSNDPDQPEFPVQISTLRPTPVIEVVPRIVDFGRVPERTTSEQQVLVQNIGTAQLIVHNMRLEGSRDFRENIAESLDTDGLSFPVSVAVAGVEPEPNQVADIEFTMEYEPLSPGGDSAILIIEYDRDGDPDTDDVGTFNVDVTGEGGAPDLQITPNPIDFGERPVNVASRMTVTLANLGTSDLEIESITLDRSRTSREFSIDEITRPDLPATLTAEDAIDPEPTTSFVVTYTPTTFDAHAGVLLVEHSASDRPAEVPLAGVGSTNTCPLADAFGTIQEDPENRRGTEIDWAIPLQTLVLDGTESLDADGDPLDYIWEITRKPEGAVNGLRPFAGAPSDPSRRQYFLPIAGRYEFQLRVVDDAGCESEEPATITVVAVPDEAISVELTWFNPLDPDEDDSEGSDVDLHFAKMGFAEWFADPFDTYFANKSPNWGPERPSLDIDDTDGGGPETIQMDDPQSCQWYAVGVHYFRKAFGTAYATVRIHIDGELRAEFPNRPLRNDNDFWDVARIHWPSRQIFVVDEVMERFDTSENVVPGPTDEMLSATGLCGDL